MTFVFADTSFYVAVLSPRDVLNERAVEFMHQFCGTMVTTEYVLVELGNWLSRSGDRRVFVELLPRLQSDPNTIIVSASADLFDRGFSLYSGREDKDWSLTDCISFVVMKERNLSDGLTADHHFEQAGFTVLLK